ncbi:putative bifunctional diguanylate cyclase/phosphodiesterase [Methyloversatilis thermotolerans]|uniref:putative bifunctional diguanylate cyclase/phosphodiesterase n=1 Tax=Methyloversatilis thermotolerans TaxID=1346290 RepID=UPI00036CE0ED|nr:EAL domain-containing protein [Methyloversatilis thermotolerans]
MVEPVCPPDPGSIESAEVLREALHSLQRQHEALRVAHDHVNQLLQALDTLLGDGAADDAFACVFNALHKTFVFSQALALAEGSDGLLEAVVAEPVRLVGSRWPVGDFFRKVMDGKVIATFANDALPEWRGAGRLGLCAAQSALYVPLRMRRRRGILVLLRAPGDAGFDRTHVALARKFSLLASHAMAAREASQGETERNRLQALTERLRLSELSAKRNADLLNEIVNLLPVGVTVQDENGRFVLVNDAAAAPWSLPASALRGRQPYALLAREEAETMRVADQVRLHSDRPGSEERTVLVGSDEVTLLSSYKPVRIFDERLLLTTSLDITERKRFEDELSHLAFHDPMTGLPNRALMQEMVDAALRSHERGGMFALAFIDLDNFKQVNDYYSHAIGDALLMEVARRVSNSMRSSDTLARISGDEFLLLINPLERQEDLPPVIDRVVAAIKQPFTIEGYEVLTSASVGASIFPLHGTHYEALRRCADSAMYRAKSERKGSAAYFDASMGAALTARMELEQRLRNAIRDHAFRCAYQPKVDMRSGRIVGFEALIRWIEADGSVRMPGSFIELATELGLLDDITRFALADACRDIRRLQARHGRDVTVSVNIGARQAGDTAFMEMLIAAIADSGVAPSLILELTEDALVATQRFQRQVLPALRELGVRVSIDDFGSGYSSLSTLADITADEVKVDRAFVHAIHERPRSQGILRAIESLCSALGVVMVAEGVETIEELDYLRTHTQIGVAQGYYFSRPEFIDTLCRGREHAGP